MKEFECITPSSNNRRDVEAAVPKVIVTLGEVVAKAGDTGVFGELGLTTIKYILLHVLSKHATSPTMTELRKHLLRSPANLTRLVDDLEEEGLIRRVASPNDRRVHQIQLTDAGHTRIHDAEEHLADQMSLFFKDYTTEELTTLLSLLIRVGNDMITILGLEGNFTYSESKQ